MKSIEISSHQAAVYLLKAPAQFTVQVNRELVVVYSAPELMVAGVAVFPGEMSLKDVLPPLETLLGKFQTEFKTKPEQIRVKIFGMSEPQRTVLSGVTKWLKQKNLRITSSDTGRQVARSLVVQCETGLVGVSYAEGITPETGDWLSEGSSAGRAPFLMLDNKILVLSTNRVSRQLCRQAIEEHEGWAAECPETPYDTLTQKTTAELPWRAILVFDDVGKGKPVERFLTRMHVQHPRVAAAWIGKNRPRFAKHVVLMPELKPQSVKKFKTQLGKLITEVVDTSLAAEVFTLPLPVKKRTKRS
jgi:hypothetical protein